MCTCISTYASPSQKNIAGPTMRCVTTHVEGLMRRLGLLHVGGHDCGVDLRMPTDKRENTIVCGPEIVCSKNKSR